MRRSLICILPALAVFVLAPFARANSIYVYDLTAEGGVNGNMTGSITLVGNDGDAVPLLNSADVLSFQFQYTGNGHQYNFATSTILSNSMTFNGDLGAATLQGTSGLWEIADPGFGNVAFFLFGQSRENNFGEYWGLCRPDATLACLDTGGYHQHWTLTLASETVNPAPEPGSVWLGLGALAVFGVRRAVRALSV